jgi:hypothetical protein
MEFKKSKQKPGIYFAIKTLRRPYFEPPNERRRQFLNKNFEKNTIKIIRCKIGGWSLS